MINKIFIIFLIIILILILLYIYYIIKNSNKNKENFSIANDLCVNIIKKNEDLDKIRECNYLYGLTDTNTDTNTIDIQQDNTIIYNEGDHGQNGNNYILKNINFIDYDSGEIIENNDGLINVKIKKGQDGPTGSPGPDGVTGLPGNNGKSSDMCKIDLKGPIGNEGPKGPIGNRGRRGPKGLDANDGKNGKDCFNTNGISIGKINFIDDDGIDLGTYDPYDMLHEIQSITRTTNDLTVILPKYNELLLKNNNIINSIKANENLKLTSDSDNNNIYISKFDNIQTTGININNKLNTISNELKEQINLDLKDISNNIIENPFSILYDNSGNLQMMGMDIRMFGEISMHGDINIISVNPVIFNNINASKICNNKTNECITNTDLENIIMNIQ